MKKLLLCTMITVFMLLTSGSLQAQTPAAKTNPAPSPTPENVLNWAKEYLPEINKSLPALQKINPTSEADKKAKARFLQSAEKAKEIIAKGSGLTKDEARSFDIWMRIVLSESLDECLTANPGSECCFARQYQNQGWGGLWYRARCFIARFPGIN